MPDTENHQVSMLHLQSGSQFEFRRQASMAKSSERTKQHQETKIDSRFRRWHQQHSQIVYNKEGGGRGWKRVQKFPGTHPFPFSLNNHLPAFIALHPYWHFKAVLYSTEKLTQAKKQKNPVNHSNIFQMLQINLTSSETYQDTIKLCI